MTGARDRFPDRPRGDNVTRDLQHSWENLNKARIKLQDTAEDIIDNREVAGYDKTNLINKHRAALVKAKAKFTALVASNGAPRLHTVQQCTTKIGKWEAQLEKYNAAAAASNKDNRQWKAKAQTKLDKWRPRLEQAQQREQAAALEIAAHFPGAQPPPQPPPLATEPRDPDLRLGIMFNRYNWSPCLQDSENEAWARWWDKWHYVLNGQAGVH